MSSQASETFNVKITDANLEIEDHGMLAWSIHFAGTIAGAIGTYTLDYKPHLGVWTVDDGGRGILAIKYIMLTLDVRQWARLPGIYCRVEIESGNVIAIQHIIDSRKFWFRTFMKNKTPLSSSLSHALRESIYPGYQDKAGKQ